MIFPAFPSVTFAALDIELARERAARQARFPELIATARLSPADAEAALAVVDAWRQDCERQRDFRDRSWAAWSARNLDLWASITMQPATHGIDWRTRRHALGREITRRTRAYPEQVATASLGKADAEHRLACLQALARIYDQGFDWPHEKPAADPAFWRWQLGLPGQDAATIAHATAMLGQLGEAA